MSISPAASKCSTRLYFLLTSTSMPSAN
jgi:hypothetical protein